MRTPSLSGSIARGLILAKDFAVVSLGLLLAGCASPQDTALLGVALSGVAPYGVDPRAAASAAAMGQALTTVGSAQASALSAPTGAANSGAAPLKHQSSLTVPPIAQVAEINTRNRTITLVGKQSQLLTITQNSRLIRSGVPAKITEIRKGDLVEEVATKNSDGIEEISQLRLRPNSDVDNHKGFTEHERDSRSISVSPPVKSGLVDVASQQVGADIYVDGAFMGNVSSKLKLPEGTHVIEVRKDGFKPFKRELKVTEGSELKLQVVLERR